MSNIVESIDSRLEMLEKKIFQQDSLLSEILNNQNKIIDLLEKNSNNEVNLVPSHSIYPMELPFIPRPIEPSNGKKVAPTLTHIRKNLLKDGLKIPENKITLKLNGLKFCCRSVIENLKFQVLISKGNF